MDSTKKDEIPRSLDTIDFIIARRAESVKLARDLREYHGNKQAWQRLPPHLRRRTMSHTPSKLPRNIRHRHFCQAKGSTTSTRHRKGKRRPKTVLNDHSRRQVNQRWLETHVWHAKRMHMGSVGDARVALRPTAKGTRFNHKSACTHAVVHDQSYMHLVVVRALDEDSLHDGIRRLLPPHAPYPLEVRQGIRHMETIAYRVGTYPWGCLGPVRIWCPPAQRVAWIWADPRCARGVEDVFRGVRGLRVQRHRSGDGVGTFFITGPSTHRILGSVVHPARPGSPAAMAWRALAHPSASVPPGAVPPRVVLTLDVRVQGGWDDDAHSEAHQEDTTFSILTDWPKGTCIDPPPFPPETRKEEEGENQEDGDEPIAVEEDEPIAVEEDEPIAVEEDEPIAVEDNHHSEELIVDGDPPSRHADDVLRVVLMHRPASLSRGFGAGWWLIVPKGSCMRFWPKLVFAGGRPIGIDDLRALATERSCPSFPKDYPDTPTYCHYALHHEASLRATYHRRPPAKRINYASVETLDPFHAPWTRVFSDVPPLHPDPACLPYYVLRDREQLNAALDPASATAGPSEENAHPYALVAVTVRMNRRGRIPWNSEIVMRRDATESEADDVDAQPRTIGYITSDIEYSLIRGRGWGLGYCALEPLRGTRGRLPVHISMPSSSKYYPALLNVLGT